MRTVRHGSVKNRQKKLKKSAKKIAQAGFLKPFRKQLRYLIPELRQIKKRISPGILARIFIFTGLFLIVFPPVYKKITDPSAVTGSANYGFMPQASSSAELFRNPIRIDQAMISFRLPSQPPQRIVVPEIGGDLPIVEARIVNGFWELSETTASHGVGSANPGDGENVVVFAHARMNLFGPLKNIKKNQKIYILTKDRWFVYTVRDIKFVKPDQVEVIKPTEHEMLTLFTCSGFLDTKRLIVKAEPIL